MAADRRDINRLNISKGSRLRKSSYRDSALSSGRSADTKISHTDVAGMVLDARVSGGKYYSVPLFDFSNLDDNTPSIRTEGDNLTLTGKSITIKKDVTIGDNIKLGIDDGNLKAGESTFSYGNREVLKMFGIAGSSADHYVSIPSDKIAFKMGYDDDFRIEVDEIEGVLKWVNIQNNEAGSVLYIGTTATGQTQMVSHTTVYTTFDAATKSVGIGTSTFDSSSENYLAIKNGDQPSAHTDNQIYIGSKDSTTVASNGATLSLFTEAAVESSALGSAGDLDRRISVWINGTEYWLYLDVAT